MKILVVEDNIELLHSIKDLLSVHFTVDTASDGDEGLFLALQNIYDAIVLDVMLPGINGFEIIQRMRTENVRTPVLFLTAKDSLEDRVKGLDFGADDYLVKPFQAPELEARLRAMLRRSGSLTTKQTLCFEDIELHGREKEITINGEAIKLTLKQYDLLEFFIQNVGTILTKEQIYDRIWGFDSDTSVAVVEVFTHHLRKKMEPFGYDKYLQTVRGIGYCFKKPDSV